MYTRAIYQGVVWPPWYHLGYVRVSLPPHTLLGRRICTSLLPSQHGRRAVCATLSLLSMVGRLYVPYCPSLLPMVGRLYVPHCPVLSMVGELYAPHGPSFSPKEGGIERASYQPFPKGGRHRTRLVVLNPRERGIERASLSLSP